MDFISCSEVENYLSSDSGYAVSPDRKTALEKHRANCPHCRQFTAEARSVRELLLTLPALEVSSEFLPNLRREIARLEYGRQRASKRAVTFPQTVAISTGFATALLVGFLLFRPGMQSPDGDQGRTPGIMAEQTPQIQAPEVVQNPPSQIAALPATTWMISDSLEQDTNRHRLPETPGKQQIPIPAHDDLWRINQVSSNP
jgi:hypothetical protein